MRWFKVAAFALLAASLLLGMTAHSGAVLAETATEDPEVYIGSAEGYAGRVLVEVMLADEEIVDIRVLESQEIEEHAYLALLNIPQRILTEQSPDVEAVTGATITSEAIIEAVEDALAEADWKGIEDPLADIERNVYTVSSEGYGGEMEVKVTMENDEIAFIEIVDHEEVSEVAYLALRELPRSIVRTQSTDVDVISGVTETSEGIIEAVEEALKKHGE